jgi:Clp amino terminal domain, pathogenicity island component
MRPAERYLMLGAAEARKAGDGFVGMEHVLAALLGDRAERLGESGPPAKIDPDALATLGIDLDVVRTALDRTFGPGALERTHAACLGVSPRLKLALSRAVDYADGGPVDDVHILLGILSVRDGSG